MAQIPFTVDGDIVTMLDPRVSGRVVSVTMRYRPALNGSGGEGGGGTTPTSPLREIKAMNPAHIVYECLTNKEWGRGLDPSVIDLNSFIASAQTLFTEQFGLCMRWNRTDAVGSFVQSVLDHCGATLYSNRTNALLTMDLIRGNYIKSSLPIWTTQNGILEISESTVNTASAVINEVIVNYLDPVYNETRSVRAQNLASIQSMGGAFNTQTKDYKGIPTTELASRIAQRDLRAHAEGLRRFKLVMDRRAWNIVPGQVMRIQDAQRAIPDMVVRVARVEDGTLRDGRITLDVAQDVFSFPAKSFTGPQPPAWGAPSFQPCVGRHAAFEAPYFLVNRQTRPADFALFDEASAFVATVVELGRPANMAYDVAVRYGEPAEVDWPSEGEQSYCGYTPPSTP